VDKTKCSFCGKSERFGVRLVLGPDVAICEECVKLAAEVIDGMPEPERPAGRIELRTFGTAEGRALQPPPDE
jgi:ATP-dependent Clp protease ATP-binding subunit ClpX